MTRPATLAYLAVRHLPTAEAARMLGKASQSVEEYRRNHPDAAFDAKAVKPERTARPGTISLAIPTRDTSRSSEGTTARAAYVTLPAPPPGPHCVPFERNGVRA